MRIDKEGFANMVEACAQLFDLIGKEKGGQTPEAYDDGLRDGISFMLTGVGMISDDPLPCYEGSNDFLRVAIINGVQVSEVLKERFFHDDDLKKQGTCSGACADIDIDELKEIYEKLNKLFG